MNKLKRYTWLLRVSLLINIIGFSLLLGAFIFIGSPTYILALINNRGQGIFAHKIHRKTLFDKMSIDSNAIVMLGNSITAGCEWHELMANKNIINRGIMGDGTLDIFNRLSSILPYQPKKIFLLIGVNDLMFHTPQYIAENYEKIVVNILTLSPNTRLYLESVLPVHEELRKNGLSNEDIRDLNNLIENIGRKYNLTYIDLFSSFCTKNGALNPNYSIDGIHLNGDGYLVFKRLIEEKINE